MGCMLCPRRCGADRKNSIGICGASDTLKIARAMPHFWEEPCISGINGSGTVFFSGCQLGCVYCQNREISRAQAGKVVSVERLTEIYFELAQKGVHNINLVTPDPYLPLIKASVIQAKEQGLALPFLMNCSGYETVEMIRSMDGLIDIFLPDFKYMSPLLSKKYSHASDYPAVAKKALAEMVRQQPKAVFDKNGMMQKGVIVRHLLLPGCTEDSKRVLAYLYQTYKDSIYISIMSQFTPLELKEYPELDRCVSETEYEELIDFAQKLGVTQAYIQEGSAASESFIPAFDCEGV
ncbi:MAG: radical SAM protein [Clostridia bacterium]|nr:radical SAM protein [Clostridia bacterium]